MHTIVYHDFVENWFSHITEKLRRGTLLFSEKVPYRKSFWIGGDITTFSRNFFCLTAPKKFLVWPFLVEKVSGLKKLHKMVYHDFVENWFSHSTEKFRRGTLLLSEKFFYRKKIFMDGNGISRFSLKIFCLSFEKSRRGTLLFQKISGSKKIA